MRKELTKHSQLVFFYALVYFPMIYIIPNSSSLGWLIGIICGNVGRNILKD